MPQLCLEQKWSELPTIVCLNPSLALTTTTSAMGSSSQLLIIRPLLAIEFEPLLNYLCKVLGKITQTKIYDLENLQDLLIIFVTKTKITVVE